MPYPFNNLVVNTSISQATTRIINEIYVQKSSAVVVTAGYINEPNRLRQSDLINEVVQHSGPIKFRVEDFGHISSTYSEGFNVLFIDSYEGFT